MPAVFSDEEVVTFLAFVRETNTFKAIDGRVQRNIEVFNRLNSLTIDTIRIKIKTKRLESSGEQNGNLSRKGSWMKRSRKTSQVCDLQYVYLHIYICNGPFYNNLCIHVIGSFILIHDRRVLYTKPA